MEALRRSSTIDGVTRVGTVENKQALLRGIYRRKMKELNEQCSLRHQVETPKTHTHTAWDNGPGSDLKCDKEASCQASSKKSKSAQWVETRSILSWELNFMVLQQ